MPNIKEVADRALKEIKQGQWTEDLMQIKAVLGMVIGTAQRIKQGVSEDDWDCLKWRFYGLCKKIIGIQKTEDYYNFIHYLEKELEL